MNKKRMVKLESDQKPTAEVSEVHALLDVMKAIKIKESQIKKKRLVKKSKINT